MAKLRVVLATRFPYHERDGFSGLLQVSQQLADALALRDDIELHVVSGTSHLTQPERRTYAGYDCHFFPYGAGPVHYGSFFVHAGLAMRRAILGLQPDIVHCQAAAETAIGSILTGLPLVTTIHGIYSAEAGNALSWKARLVYRIQTLVEAWYTPRLRDVIASSPYVARFVRARNPQARLYEMANPIDRAFFAGGVEQPQGRPGSILLLGVISYRKGHDLMGTAFARLAARHPEAQLTVVGNTADADLEQMVRRQLAAAGLEQRVRWLGPISQERLLEELRGHQILCLPSREETRPMSLLQAMALGNLCVASDAGGIPDMLQHGVNGFMFPRGDAVGLERALEQALSLAPEAAAAMRRRNRTAAEAEFHPDAVAAQTVSVYHRVLALAGRALPEAT